MIVVFPGVNFPDGTRKLTTWLPSATLWVKNDDTNEKNWMALGVPSVTIETEEVSFLLIQLPTLLARHLCAIALALTK